MSDEAPANDKRDAGGEWSQMKMFPAGVDVLLQGLDGKAKQ